MTPMTRLMTQSAVIARNLCSKNSIFNSENKINISVNCSMILPSWMETVGCLTPGESSEEDNDRRDRMYRERRPILKRQILKR